mmetsp:Transcript_11419/g.17985  ORF Transcript_11419/g.17985 Transcript_11419/m.17985 type:complete len:100 (+) Transcript_11419:1068-1367(+)
MPLGTIASVLWLPECLVLRRHCSIGSSSQRGPGTCRMATAAGSRSLVIQAKASTAENMVPQHTSSSLGLCNTAKLRQKGAACPTFNEKVAPHAKGPTSP